MTDTDVSRRAFLRTAAGGAALAATAGTAAAQGEIDYGGWFDGVGNFDGSTADATGQSEVTVTVGAEGNGGAFAFDPPAVQVDPGTTVKFEWTGNGGQHNVVAEEGADFESELFTEAGVHFEHTFESEGIVTYFCQPHLSLGMKGAVAVGGASGGGDGGGGDGDGGGGGGGGGEGPQVPESAKALGVATTVAMVATLGLAYVFIKYGGDYEQPE